MYQLLLLSLFFKFISWFAPLAEPEENRGFQFNNYKKSYVKMPEGMEQAVEGMGVYEHAMLTISMANLGEKEFIDEDSLLTNIGNTGIFDAFCDPYEPATDFGAGQHFDRVKITLVGKIPYSTNFTTTVVFVEYDVMSYCDNKFVTLLLNTKGNRILSLARVALHDFQKSRLGNTRLTQDHTFYYEDEPYYEDVVISREGMKVLKADGKKKPEKQDVWADYIINYATFRIDKDGYIVVVEKGWIY
ncbi:hypothetical protein [Pontibacter pamirensis]|uniref:hypothetical protein n=1 Tax=Pontibacter pamirensis TaxID=2562824 RepID=UPI00138A6633|nr:hypothetical protein [Pontibacter pamirensis]